MSNYSPLEYPKWREGVLIQNADHEDEHFGNIVILSNMPGPVPIGENAHQEYPKWVGGALVNSEDEELVALEHIAAMEKSAAAVVEETASLFPPGAVDAR